MQTERNKNKMHQKLIVGRLACACPIACGAHYFHLRERDERQKVENPGVAGRFSFFCSPSGCWRRYLTHRLTWCRRLFICKWASPSPFGYFLMIFFVGGKKAPHTSGLIRDYMRARVIVGPRADENRCGGDGCTSSDCGCRWMLFLWTAWLDFNEKQSTQRRKKKHGPSVC